MVLRGQCGVVRGRTGFFENNIFATKWIKIEFSYFIGKLSHFFFFFLNLVYNESLFYLLYSCANPVFGGKSGSWDMGQNARGQLDCRILKPTISLKLFDENWNILGEDVVKNGCVATLGSHVSKIGCISVRKLKVAWKIQES